MWIRTSKKVQLFGKDYWNRLREPTSPTDVTALFRHISLHGYAKLVEKRFSLLEKFIWLLVHITTMCCLLFMLIESWEEFVARYIVVQLVDSRYPIENIAFPAVTICDSNRISRTAATKYAQHLSELDPMNRNVSYFLKMMEGFILFHQKYNLHRDFSEYEEFQTFLNQYDIAENETFFNTKRFMQQVSTKCVDLILHCSLGDNDIDCFGAKAFVTMPTMYGFCCTFNTNDSYKQRSIKDRFLNKELGLSIVLNSSTADDLVPMLNIQGYVVIIHDSFIYPDVASGYAREVFPSHNTESYVAIKPHASGTAAELRMLSYNTRKCYFDEEAPDRGLFIGSSYHFANCVTRCRMRSIVTLCRCVPYYMPSKMINLTDGTVYCNLQHLSCLQSYNFKWNNVLTVRDVTESLEREIEEALYCPHCLPACETVLYDPSLLDLPIESIRTAFQLNTSLRKYANADVSVLRVHFQEAVTKYYKRTLGNDWFEALYKVGNISSIILGFSVVALFEIGFFLVRRLVRSLLSFLRNNLKRSRKVSIIREPTYEGKSYMCP